MNGKLIIVSGSSKGIGKATSELLLTEGATVVGLSRTQGKFNPHSGNYIQYNCNIENLDELTLLFSQILLEHPRIDGFVSCAGFGDFRGFENFSVSQIISFLHANLLSHIIMTRLLLPAMKKQKSGRIVFIGSEAALKGSQKGSMYNTAKFGLRGFSQSIREECSKSNVHVSIVNPGMVRTNFFSELKFAPGDHSSNAIDPIDVAKVVLGILTMREGTVIDEINLSPLKKVVKFKKDLS